MKRITLKQVKPGQEFRFFSDSESIYRKVSYNRSTKKYLCHSAGLGLSQYHCGFVPVYVLN